METESPIINDPRLTLDQAVTLASGLTGLDYKYRIPAIELILRNFQFNYPTPDIEHDVLQTLDFWGNVYRGITETPLACLPPLLQHLISHRFAMTFAMLLGAHCAHWQYKFGEHQCEYWALKRAIQYLRQSRQSHELRRSHRLNAYVDRLRILKTPFNEFFSYHYRDLLPEAVNDSVFAKETSSE